MEIHTSVMPPPPALKAKIQQTLEVMSTGVDIARHGTQANEAQRLLFCNHLISYADLDNYARRADFIAAFMNQINPKSVRSAGNQDSAEFLESKLCEWDDLLHAYEILRDDMFPDDSIRRAIALVRIDRMRDPALKRIALAQIGVSMEEHAATNPSGDLFAA